jgi:RES domain-containing protein
LSQRLRRQHLVRQQCRAVRHPPRSARGTKAPALGGAGLALVVPSVIVPQEKNYVLNVAHAQFANVRVANVEPFSRDERLWGAKR